MSFNISFDPEFAELHDSGNSCSQRSNKILTAIVGSDDESYIFDMSTIACKYCSEVSGTDDILRFRTGQLYSSVFGLARRTQKFFVLEASNSVGLPYMILTPNNQHHSCNQQKRSEDTIYSEKSLDNVENLTQEVKYLTSVDKAKLSTLFQENGNIIPLLDYDYFGIHDHSLSTQGLIHKIVSHSEQITNLESGFENVSVENTEKYDTVNYVNQRSDTKNVDLYDMKLEKNHVAYSEAKLATEENEEIQESLCDRNEFSTIQNKFREDIPEKFVDSFSTVSSPQYLTNEDFVIVQRQTQDSIECNSLDICCPLLHDCSGGSTKKADCILPNIMKKDTNDDTYVILENIQSGQEKYPLRRCAHDFYNELCKDSERCETRLFSKLGLEKCFDHSFEIRSTKSTCISSLILKRQNKKSCPEDSMPNLTVDVPNFNENVCNLEYDSVVEECVPELSNACNPNNEMTNIHKYSPNLEGNAPNLGCDFPYPETRGPSVDKVNIEPDFTVSCPNLKNNVPTLHKNNPNLVVLRLGNIHNLAEESSIVIVENTPNDLETSVSTFESNAYQVVDRYFDMMPMNSCDNSKNEFISSNLQKSSDALELSSSVNEAIDNVNSNDSMSKLEKAQTILVHHFASNIALKSISEESNIDKLIPEKDAYRKSIRSTADFNPETVKLNFMHSNSDTNFQRNHIMSNETLETKELDKYVNKSKKGYSASISPKRTELYQKVENGDILQTPNALQDDELTSKHPEYTCLSYVCAISIVCIAIVIYYNVHS